jgi:hypothetical protein
MSQPLVPFVRIIDVFSPTDAAIKIVASGGVTSALALPGSGNLMGGEAYVFKLRPTESYSNEDMLVQANINEEEEKKWRWMKMACGENPKVVLSPLFIFTFYIKLLFSVTIVVVKKCHIHVRF